MSKIVHELKKHECAGPFLEPVDPSFAPGYLDVIKHPMDIRTLGKLLKEGNFSSGKHDFVSAVRQIWDNCYAYNATDSQIYAMAQSMDEYFEGLLQAELNAIIAEPVMKKVPKETKAASAETTVEEHAKKRKKADEKDSPIVSALKQLLKELSKDPRAAPFLSPVELANAPGYFEIVKDPVDVSLIYSRLSSYEANPSQFLRDFELMFDNCQAYNADNSDLYQVAEALRGWVRTKFQQVADTFGIVVNLEEALHRPESFPEMEILPPVVLAFDPKPPPLDERFPVVGKIDAEMRKHRSKHPTSSENLSGTLALTVQDADRLLDNLLNDESGNNTYIKTKGYQMAAKTLLSTQFPFRDKRFTVENIGFFEELPPKEANSYLFGPYLVPNCYASSCRMKLYEKKRSRKSKSLKRFVVLNFVSFVLYNGGKAAFAVALRDGITVAHGESPRALWDFILGDDGTQSILRHLGGKIRRCRAVLNRLSTNPLCVPFLEKVDPKHPAGVEYYSEIKAPMWLSEVYLRLLEGAYNSETDFYFDMQLIFSNAIEYNAPNSDMYNSANTLRSEFELLYCQWVINVRDRSVVDQAKGPWDHWTYLRYFDAPTKMENVCRASGVKASEESLLFCSSCEDQYLPSAIGASSSSRSKQNWMCERCIFASEMDINKPLCVQGYSTEENNEALFTRAPELGAGWLKSVARGGKSATLCMSPMGEVIENSSSAIEKRKREEAANFTRLKHVREAEFARECKLGHRLDIASRLKMRNEKDQDRAQIGVFANPTLAANFTEWCIINKDSDVEFIDISSLPFTGLFGLEVDTIRRLIEGVKHSTTIPDYRFMDAPGIRQSFISELTRSRDARRARKVNEERANDYIARERWYWDMQLYPQRGVSRKGGHEPPKHLCFEIYSKFCNLFPEDLSSEEGEALLAIWDFMICARPVISENGLSLQELIRAVISAVNPMLPSSNQVPLDEVCCSLTGFLFEDTKKKLPHGDLALVHEVLWGKPLNFLTWPYLAAQIIIFYTQWSFFQRDCGLPYPREDSILSFFRRPLEGNSLMVMRLLSLLVSNPLFSFVMKIEKMTDNARFSPSIIQQRCIDTLCNESSGYSSVSDFVADVEVLWEGIYAKFKVDTAAYAAATMLERWFTSLLLGLNINRGKLLRPRKEFSVETDHPSCWGDAQRIRSKDLQIPLNGIVYSFDNYRANRGFGSFYGTSLVNKLSQWEQAGDSHQVMYQNSLRCHPGCFESYSALLNESLDPAVHRLEIGLTALLNTNPDFWNKDERIAVLSVLTGLAAQSALFRDHISASKSVVIPPPRSALQAKAGSSPSMCRSLRVASKDISDVPLQPRQLVESLEEFSVSSKSTDYAGVRCFFSGTEVAHGRSEQWVYVPKYLLRTPIGEPLVNSSSMRPVALKALTLRIAAARELAEEDHRLGGVMFSYNNSTFLICVVS